MPILFKRKILQIGDSIGVTIPEEIVKTYKLKKGEDVYLITDGIEGFCLIDLMRQTRDEIWKMLE